ncbi:MAG: hypothetical protein KQH59_05720 [Desulfobulbaceae bacterium]|nr:hypothetical protein [Desulfobulbaceae bacterium]
MVKKRIAIPITTDIPMLILLSIPTSTRMVMQIPDTTILMNLDLTRISTNMPIMTQKSTATIIDEGTTIGINEHRWLPAR